ncbi:GntR family transcriptional regulator [Halioglobus pacificus]|uniref:GntR family transcriptional regulator n=1 Tax=Parahalioglobus pacificus TaxID=930806 RepID=A0A918XEG6_9GAMM|nr:GntR family transcriptional regulator [Halioglobus pacificus]NQY02078.1 GntR family transcriptional regulator [Halieaceae bacterium]GHD27034.1 GntR family transcriptional regulator [Halioglobus pacificus]
MAIEWEDNQPIYRQLRDLVVQRIMDGTFAEGEAVPSVRQVAADYQINHLTVGKAYQELVDTGLLEKRRGLGMFVTSGARGSLTSNEKQRFVEEELPAFVQRAHVLGMELSEVVDLLLETRGEE